MSAGAAALWLAHHGTTDAAVLTALNDLRSLSYFIALVPFAVFLVAVGTAARTTRGLPGWASVIGDRRSVWRWPPACRSRRTG